MRQRKYSPEALFYGTQSSKSHLRMPWATPSSSQWPVTQLAALRTDIRGKIGGAAHGIRKVGVTADDMLAGHQQEYQRGDIHDRSYWNTNNHQSKVKFTLKLPLLNLLHLLLNVNQQIGLGLYGHLCSGSDDPPAGNAPGQGRKAIPARKALEGNILYAANRLSEGNSAAGARKRQYSTQKVLGM